uniref:Uncharacterized protein n=1 Tax=Romanomermis culicivorax TaxID=13658 RepID=A0A915HGI6_ROMCU
MKGMCHVRGIIKSSYKYSRLNISQESLTIVEASRNVAVTQPKMKNKPENVLYLYTSITVSQRTSTSDGTRQVMHD